MRNEESRKFFEVEVKNEIRKGYVYAPSSLDNPQSNTVMFVTPSYIYKWENLTKVKDCLVFWPNTHDIPETIKEIHFFVPCDKPRREFAKFFKKNNVYETSLETENNIRINRFHENNISVMPNAYIGDKVVIGNNVYVGSGVRIVGNVHIGNNVIIRENSVLGADGLSIERDKDGIAIPIPQFGGIEVGDNVVIGANVVIARGAIDNTIIGNGCIIGNGSSISHNCRFGRSVIVAEKATICGSVVIDDNVWIGPGGIISDGITIGKGAYIALGSVVRKSIGSDMAAINNSVMTISKFESICSNFHAHNLDSKI